MSEPTNSVVATTSPLTYETINARVDALSKRVDSLARSLQRCFTSGNLRKLTAEKQAKALIAGVVIQQVVGIRDELAKSMAYLTPPSTENGGLVGELFGLVTEFVDEMAETYGVRKEACAVYVSGYAAEMLPLAESLTLRAETLLAEATAK